MHTHGKYMYTVHVSHMEGSDYFSQHYVTKKYPMILWCAALMCVKSSWITLPV